MLLLPSANIFSKLTFKNYFDVKQFEWVLISDQTAGKDYQPGNNEL